MFPFNQSYRPRRVSPDLPVLPVSNVHSPASRESLGAGILEDHSYVPPSGVGRKNGKKRRVKTRPTPYSRPILPTPSSPSEAEYEPGREDNVVSKGDRIECVMPMQLYKDQPEDVSEGCERPQDENMQEEVMPGNVVIKSIAYEGVPEEGAQDDSIQPQVIPDQVIEEVMQEEVMQEEVIQEEIIQEVIQEEVSQDDVDPDTLMPEEANPQEIIQDEETPDQVQDHVIEEITPDNTVQNTIAQEILQDEDILVRIQQKVIQDNLFTKEDTVTEERILENPMDKILNWGDLVVVEYAERRKTYQWPAIVVPPAHMTDNMLNLPPEDDETAIGIRWIEPSPSYSWIPEENVTRITPDMVEEYHSRAKVTGPKKLVRAWELAHNPPSVWEYMLEKKMSYHVLVEKYKS